MNQVDSSRLVGRKLWVLESKGKSLPLKRRIQIHARLAGADWDYDGLPLTLKLLLDEGSAEA